MRLHGGFLKNPKDSVRNFIEITNLWKIEIAKVLTKRDKIVKCFFIFFFHFLLPSLYSEDQRHSPESLYLPGAVGIFVMWIFHLFLKFDKSME